MEKTVDIFGTLGPSYEDEDTLKAMFEEGMTGIRINLSHVMLKDCHEKIDRIKAAARLCGITPKILIDMQGPELRIGNLEESLELAEGDEAVAVDVNASGNRQEATKDSDLSDKKCVPVDHRILEHLRIGQEVLLDDGKILAQVVSALDDANNSVALKVKRGGILNSRKSIAIIGESIDMPALTDTDRENLSLAGEYGITGVMQPFVRSADDLILLRKVLDEFGGQAIKIYAKIENMAGVNNIESFLPHADEIIIARGDLGNAMPLWELPKVQKDLSRICNSNNMPFMVVTQMLSSMEHSRVPTRAEVSDIFNAVLDGAASVMVTGETAVGDNPVEVIKYLSRTAHSALNYC